MSRAIILPGLLGLSLPLFAHDLWFERDASGYTLLQGHRHSGHAGADTQSYDPAWVQEIVCATGGGTGRVTPVTGSRPVRIAAACSLIQARVVSGYWTKTAWETRNTAKSGLSGVLKSWHADESVKRLDRWTPSFAKPLGDDLEICPTTNPLALKPGDKLVVQVFFQGKPQGNVPVAYFGDTRGSTDDEGRIAIRLRQTGVQLIAASFETPLNDGKADTSIRGATLQFEIAP